MKYKNLMQNAFEIKNFRKGLLRRGIPKERRRTRVHCLLKTLYKIRLNCQEKINIAYGL